LLDAYRSTGQHKARFTTEDSRVGRGRNPPSPSSNRMYRFPVHGFPAKLSTLKALSMS
jgi:hypothetical protein